MKPQVSIVVRACNDIAYIEQTLEMISRQSFQNFQLLCPDSNSTDGTYEKLCSYCSEAYRIEGRYVPGKVLNEAVSKCRGEIIVFNNSDCVIQDERWLENLIKPFEDQQVTAVYGKQVPRKDADPLVVKDYSRAFSRESLKWGNFFSLATSAIRKSSLLEHPFNEEIQYSEDVEWAWRARQRGEKIAFAEGAVVEHSHNYTVEEIKKRFYGEGLAEPAIYGRRPAEETFPACVIKPVVAETLRDWIYLLKIGRLDLFLWAPKYRWLQRSSVYNGIKEYYT
ncbi:glycosyltransferase family 2 protein [Sedimentisphaera salicampi]|uniref:N-glycosyltransferase n=1 Tax=Sedimentisphaera salicampi TaxID=1941349 RepID=A0A1W6LJC9_9BACT|nr:glycosyltransferase family A protein [Sedimentisphaera salicampi]ARN55844.1 N-glycosyltransferase [Sedimentisphaera salicampi]